MRIEIDQSGKIEQTSIITVIGYSNDSSKTISISATEKVKLQKWFRAHGNPTLFVIKTFCALLYILVKPLLKKQQDLYIDKEYPGYEKLIKNQISLFAKADRVDIDAHYLHFTLVGRGSNAHKVAVVAHRKKKANIRVVANEVIDLIKKPGNA